MFHGVRYTLVLVAICSYSLRGETTLSSFDYKVRIASLVRESMYITLTVRERVCTLHLL